MDLTTRRVAALGRNYAFPGRYARQIYAFDFPDPETIQEYVRQAIALARILGVESPIT